MFGSIITMLITPYKDNNEVNYDEISKLLDYLMNTHTSSIALLSYFSEEQYLSENEKKEIVSYICDYSKRKYKVLVHINELQSIVLYDTMNVDGYIIESCYITKETFQKIRFLTKKPIIVKISEMRIDQEEEKKIIKDNYLSINALIVDRNSDEYQYSNCFDLYAGEEKSIIEVLSNGGIGVCSCLSNYYGEDIKEIIDDYKQGIDNKYLLHYISTLYDLLLIDATPTEMKYLMNKKGFDTLKTRITNNDMYKENRKNIDLIID